MNLDQVIDVHGNTMDYQWAIFQGTYGNNAGNSGPSLYDISSRLQAIEYGANPSAGSTQHTGKVDFLVAYRCFDTQAVCDQPGNQHMWMDVPWDQFCQTWATSCANHTPTFWNIYRLLEINTYVWNGSGWGSSIDKWETTQGFALAGDYIPPAGEDSSPSLWLMRIWRSGFPNPIEMGGVQLDNRVDYGPGAPPMMHWRVNQINTGTGENIYVTYTSRDCWPADLAGIAQDTNNRRCFPQNNAGQLSWWHKYVVTDVTSIDAFGGPNERWHYDYSFAGSSLAAAWKHDLNWHNAPNERTWSQWAGYPTVFTTHGADSGTGPQQINESLYYRGFDGDKTIAGGWGTRGVTINDGWDTLADSNSLTGQLARTYTWNGAPNPQRSNWASAVRHHPTVAQTGSYYMTSNPLIVASRVREHQTLSGTRMAGPNDRWTQTLAEYESTYGLPTKVQDLGQVIPAKTSDDRCILTTYTAANETKWIVGLPYQVLTTNCATTPAAGDYLGGGQMFYDGSTTLGAMPVKGLVTKTNALATASAAPPAAADWKQASRSANHDAYGRLKDSFDSLDRKTTIAYTPTVGGPVTGVATTGPMGAGWTTTFTLDPKRGQPTQAIDVNGKTTQAEYDTSGRLLKVWTNNRAKTLTPDAEYGYQINGTNWISAKALGPDGQQILSYQVFDGRLRLRQTQAPAANGSGRAISLNMFNGIGQVSSEANWFNADSGPTSTLVTAADKDVKVHQQYVYDNLGRRTNDQRWTGNGTTSSMLFETIYGFDGDQTITMTPPTGGTATTTIHDARGQTVELRQHLGGTAGGAVDVTTKYTYDRLGQIKQVTDNANNTWTYTYDLRRHRVSTTDPDTGTSTTTFDDAGQVIETVDGNSNKLAYKYDLLGRKTEIRETSLAGTLRASWTYDTLQKGQPTSTSRFSGTDTYTSAVGSYNDAYQPLSTTDTIPGFGANNTTLTYTVANTYKANGALATQVLPAIGGLPAETVTHTYHSSTGLPNTLASASQTYVASTSYHYDGQPDTQILGGTGKRVKLTSTFDAATRRLTNKATATETTTVGTYSTKLSDTYSYDHVGNIKSIAGQTNGVADQEECFSYDHLQRLTEAWTQTSGTCSTPQRTGADPYRRQWPTSGGYDKLGNRLKQIDKDTTDTTWNYTIGGVDSCGGASKPHAVTTITATGPKAGTPTRTFCYDVAGNTTKRTTETGAVQTLTWDKEGHLASLTEGGLTTSYIYDNAGRRLIAKNTNKSTLYLADGTELEKMGTANPLGQRYYGAAIRDASGLKWIISNHQGTGVAQIDSVSLAVNRRRTMPFGETRGTQPTWLGTKGYVGGTKDDTGLTHLGAREYDSSTGRFISRDPILNVANPQQINGYNYGNNNPTTYSDPSGLESTCDNDGNTTCGPTLPRDEIPDPDSDYEPDPDQGPSETDYCSSGRIECQAGGGVAIIIDGTIVVAPDTDQLYAAMWAAANKYCGGECPESGFLVEPTIRDELCRHNPTWCSDQNLGGVVLVGGVANLGYQAFGTPGRAPHTATVTMFDANGRVIYSRTLRSGNMTPDEKALGFPRNSLATHTEARASRLPMVNGSFIVIEGQYAPCSSCKGQMARAAQANGVTIVYKWEGGARTWVAAPGSAGWRYARLVRSYK